MYWTLSEFLSTIELRGKNWCFVELACGTGIRMPHAEIVHFYALTQGTLRLAGVGEKTVTITQGDILFVLSGEVHSLRQIDGARTYSMPLIENGPRFDRPSSIAIGEGATAARVLCGMLEVRWPSGQRPRGLPALLRISRDQCIVGFDRLICTADGEGGTSLLNHAATLLLLNGLRDHPRCQALFDESNQLDPIARAQQLIELHPFRNWTVEILARKVGMGRSNFCARFTAQTGTTPMDMLTRERMNRAVELLTMTDLKIAEVGERIGYKSEAGFHHRFVACYGMPPGKLREMQRSIQTANGEEGKNIASAQSADHGKVVVGLLSNSSGPLSRIVVAGAPDCAKPPSPTLNEIA